MSIRYTETYEGLETLRKLLTDHIRYLLTHPEELHTGIYEKPQTRGKFYSDRRKDCKEALDYLTLLAQTLPEKQLRKIFNRGSLEPLVQALLKAPEPVHKDQLKNTRVFRLAMMFIHEGETRAWKLLPTDMVSLWMTEKTLPDRARIIRTISRFIGPGRKG